MIREVKEGEVISTWMTFERDYEVETGKTEVWNVYDRRGNRLGQIRWFGRWRQYSLFPTPESVFNMSCLRDVGDVISMMMARWRASKKR